MHTPHVALFTEDVGDEWHSGGLIAAFERRGVRVTRTSLSACALDTRAASGIAIPGFDGRLPDGVFVRAVGAGTLEQITLRLGILHALDASGVTVWNTAVAIERCVDKAMALFRFASAGLPVPETLTAEGPTRAVHFVDANAPVILKPLFGSQGNGIERIDHPEALPPPEALGHVYHTQAYIPPADGQPFADYRVLVSRGRAIAAMRRTGPDWRTNVYRGASPCEIAPDEALASLAVEAARSVGADFAGVDAMRDQQGRLVLIEINSNPAWKGLQSVNPAIDIADRLVADFLEARHERALRTAFETACARELTAIKPGNVHVYAEGHGMTVADFAKSARAAAPHIAAHDTPLGRRIEAAACATFAAVGDNTNIGICLLCAPIALAAERLTSPPTTLADLRTNIVRTLDASTIEDAVHAYRAIRLMNPAGLGNAKEQDISTHPTLDLTSAMRLAADRDSIARQYATGYADIFEIGLPLLLSDGRQPPDDGGARRAVSRLHMRYLSRFPDSHIARKFGSDAAAIVQREAATVDAGEDAALLAFDASLKSRGLNPGTTADLVVATLFAAEVIAPSSVFPSRVYACLKS